MTLRRRLRPSTPRRAHARLRTALARAALRSQRKGWGPEERRTVVLGVLAAGSTAAVVVTEVGRVWRRGSAPMPSETEDLLQAAEEAVAETVSVAVAGYQDAPSGENATFALLVSFVVTFASVRGVTYLLRGRTHVGPFRHLIFGRRHIHHFVPGILIAFGAGATAILTRSDEPRPQLAAALGTGMGLTFDESALLLELEDVYWSPEGLLSVQITLAAMALMAALALALRFTRRGEELVLADGRHGAAAPSA